MKWTKTDSENHIDQNTGSLIIPKEIKEIESDAFINLPISLKSIEITNNETIIPKNCFENCVNLKSITFPFNNKQLNIGNKIFSIENNHMDQLFYLPVSIEIINGNKFYNNNKIEIPSTITSIGKNCFYECTSLQSLDIPSSIQQLEEFTFYACHSIKSLQLPTTITSLGTYCFGDCIALESIDIPSSISELPSYCFVNCSSLSMINLPSTISSIGNNCFDNCVNLQTIQLSTKLKEIPYACFNNCCSLTSVKIPKNIPFDEYAFEGCTKLKRKK